jgi:SAM-dependent methyltransferase
MGKGDVSSRREDWQHYQARLRLLPPARRANVEEYCRAAYDEPMRQILDRCIRPGDRVLDIGCGEGRWVAYLLNRGVNCVGLDFLPSAVREARRRCFPVVRRTAVLQGDATQLPFRPGSFDAILSFGLLEHFPRHEAVLRHWYDLLREGGVAIISVPNARRWDWVLYSVLRQWLVTHQLPHLRQTTRGMASTMYGHEERWTPAYLRSLCRGVQFRHVEIEGLFTLLPCFFHPVGNRLPSWIFWRVASSRPSRQWGLYLVAVATK